MRNSYLELQNLEEFCIDPDQKVNYLQRKAGMVAKKSKAKIKPRKSKETAQKCY